MDWEQVKAVLALAGTLILMLLVFVGAYWCSRLVGGGVKRPGAGTGRMALLDRTPMGRDSSLVVVRVGEKVLLLGVTPHQIQKLDELDPALYPEGAAAPPVDFVTCLKDAWRERTGSREKGDGPRR